MKHPYACHKILIFFLTLRGNFYRWLCNNNKRSISIHFNYYFKLKLNRKNVSQCLLSLIQGVHWILKKDLLKISLKYLGFRVTVFEGNHYMYMFCLRQPYWMPNCIFLCSHHQIIATSHATPMLGTLKKFEIQNSPIYDPDTLKNKMYTTLMQ